jgi:hypothetical protein
VGEILRYSDFLKTYKTRGYRLNHLEKYKKLFPIKSSSLLAGIVADLICDGHLQGNPIWRADFTSKSKKELYCFNRRIYSVFGIKGTIRKCTSNKFGKTFNLGINCSPVARILLLCGVPAGQKVLIPFDIPLWIKEDKEYFREFCRRCFSCEGGIMHEKTRRMPQVRMEMWKNEKIKEEGLKFMRSIVDCMKKYFDINSTISFPKSYCIRKDNIKTTATRMYICGLSVIKFYKEIGFDGQKQQSLKAILSSENIIKD